jgi:dihydroflavonol-4-reductase
LVGNNVVRQLLAMGRRVSVLVRDRSDPRPLQGLYLEIHHGDIRDSQAVQRACRDAAAVVHAAGYVRIGRSELKRHREINVEGARTVAQAAGRAGIRMVHVSSCDAIGSVSRKVPADENTPLKRPVGCSYVITKREAEQAVLEERARGLDLVITNPGFMLGPWDWKPSSGRMLLEVARGWGFVAPRGTLSLCDVRDVADAIISALDKGQAGRRYILAGETMAFKSVFQLFAQVTGVRPPLFCPGPMMQWIAGQLGDAYSEFSGRECDMNSAAIALARIPKNYSSERARKELGYQTRPAFQTAQDAWDWFREYGYAPKPTR